MNPTEKELFKRGLASFNNHKHGSTYRERKRMEKRMEKKRQSQILNIS